MTLKFLLVRTQLGEAIQVLDEQAEERHDDVLAGAAGGSPHRRLESGAVVVVVRGRVHGLSQHRQPLAARLAPLETGAISVQDIMC